MASEKLPQMLVRGISLISLREYVQSRLKPKDARRLFERLPAVDTEVILSAQKWQWYPFSMQRNLREEIAHHFNPRDPLEAVYEAGLFAAERETSTFHKAMIGFFSVDIVLKNSNKIWTKYYRMGKLTGTFVREGLGVVELSGFPSDPIFCPMITSWLVVAAKALKLPDAKVSETTCIHRGDANCSWDIVWNP
jgi:hypothetical protein